MQIEIPKEKHPLDVFEELGNRFKNAKLEFHYKLVIQLMEICESFTICGGYLQFYRSNQKPFDVSFIVEDGITEKNLKEYLLKGNKEWLLANSFCLYNPSLKKKLYGYKPKNPTETVFLKAK